MPGPGDLPARQPAAIIGRDAGLARLRALVDPVPRASQVLVVTGAAGMGKTVLLADAAGRARRAGMRVLPVTGRESESRLAFAGLHQLLRPVLSRVTALPGRSAPGGRPRPPALTAASRSCIWSRCPRPTPASCWTGSRSRPAGGPGRRCSPRRPVIRWR